MNVAPRLPDGVSLVTEEARGSLYHHAGWAAEMPWLIQGISSNAADMSLFAGSPAGEVMRRWSGLRDALGCTSIVHARQVHGALVHAHDTVPRGLLVAPDADGHATREHATLLAVSVADCVPVSIVAPRARVVAVLHAGWRGAAAGVLEAGITLLSSHFGVRPPNLRVHFGPAICGECYQVGPDVVAGLRLRDWGDVTHADIRALLAHRALAAGVDIDGISMSTYCTRHGESPFFSHRGGCAERQISVIGVRDD